MLGSQINTAQVVPISATPYPNNIMWIRAVAIIAIAFGVVFRCSNLDRQVYWNDEVFSSLRISGVNIRQLRREVVGRILTVDDLQQYQHFSAGHGVKGIIESCEEEPQHPPLYFILAGILTHWFGYSIAAMRGLAALFGLLLLPGIYWLCLELFGTLTTAWIGVALMAVSPFHVLYAQTARPYSLLTLLIVLSSAALLRALRLPSKLTWTVYVTVVALGLYTNLFFLMVLFGQALYLLSSEQFRPTQRTFKFLLIAGLSLGVFTPWLYVALTHFAELQSSSGWVNLPLPLKYKADIYVGDFNRLFVDVNGVLGFGYHDQWKYIFMIPNFILVIFAFYALSYLCCNLPKRTFLFLLTLIIGTGGPLGLADILLGGQRTATMRYLTPCYLGIEICVAYLLANQITTGAQRSQKIWKGITVTLLLGGVVSGVAKSSTETWWNNYLADRHPQHSSIINQTTHPLVITTTQEIIPLIALSYRLKPQTSFLVLADDHVAELRRLPKSFSDVFLFRASPQLLKAIPTGQDDKIKAVDDASDPLLWHIENGGS